MKARNKNSIFLKSLIFGCGLMLAGQIEAETPAYLSTFSIVHSFAPSVADPKIIIHNSNDLGLTNNDGAFPRSGLVLSGNTLYGTTYEGGVSGSGTIFAVNTDGTGFTNLHTFSALVTTSNGYVTNLDGAKTWSKLIVSGNTIYGAATSGGLAVAPEGNGTLFRLNTDGSGFTNLHYFSGNNTNDGSNPWGAMQWYCRAVCFMALPRAAMCSPSILTVRDLPTFTR